MRRRSAGEARPVTFALSGAAAIVSVLVLTGCGRSEDTVARTPAAITIDEYCTRCIEVLRCTAVSAAASSESEAAQQRSTRVYVLNEKSAGAQMATIFDYLRRPFGAKTEDRRPLEAYLLEESVPVSHEAALTATLMLKQRQLKLHDASIDLVSGAWLALDGRSLGTCEHLPSAQGRSFARDLASKPQSARTQR